MKKFNNDFFCKLRYTHTYISVSSDAGLSQPEPEAGIGVVDLNNLQERVKRSERMATIQLEKTKVIEKNVTTVHTKDSQWTTRQRVS